MKKVKNQAGRNKPIRVGVIGIGRGLGFARGAGEAVGMQLVALCDQWEAKLKTLKGQFPGAAFYTDYDKFLEHDMDAVILANYFHQHAPFAVKALKAGFHVMSETSACHTLGEGADLADAVERSGKIYMLAENYCFFAYIQEMRRLYRAGEIGEMRLGEGEYIHPDTEQARLARSPGLHHWRNWCPPTYYCTHALGPIMYVTDTRPTAVNARCMDYGKDETQLNAVRHGDPGMSILCAMDNGAAVVVNGLLLRGHGNWYRIHGSRGLMENLRHGDRNMLRVAHDWFDLKPGEVGERIYRPNFPVHADLAQRAGHGGGDFFTNFFFADAIRKKRQPFLDVYRALDMTVVGIQAWKSALDNGNMKPIPDFRLKSVRDEYRGENWSPFPEDAGTGQPPPSIVGIRKASRRELAEARRIWKAHGYTGE